MDPLRGSQLRVLDTGGALALVLERVDEDDALCTALVCTTFRDAVFAQARHTVRPAGEKHGGKRIVTGVGGAASSAGRLAWVRSLADEAPEWVRDWDSVTCCQLARVGALEALQWARANGCDWDFDKNAMRQYDTDASSADDTFRPVLAIPISLARILISGGPNFSGVVCVSLPASPSLSPSLRLPLCLPRWLPCFRRRFHSLCTVCKHRCQPPALSFACSTTVLSARRAARTKTSLTLTSRSWASATPSPRTTSCSSSGSSNTRTTSSLCAFAAWCYRSQSIDGNILTAGSDRADSHRLCDD